MHVQLDGTGGRLEDCAAEDDDGRNEEDGGADDDGGREEEDAGRDEDPGMTLDAGVHDEDHTPLDAVPVDPPVEGSPCDESCVPLEADGASDDDVVGLLLTSRRRQLQEPQVPSPPHTWTPAPPWGQAQFCVSPALQSCGPHARAPHSASTNPPPNNKTRRIQHLLTSGV